MTTAELRAMIAGGATRAELPTKAKGGSVSSTRDSAQIAYLNAINRARETAEFRAAQTQTARTISKARTAQMISVAENTKVMPSYDAQSQTVNYSDTSKYNVQGSNPVTNNNVNPASLYTTRDTTAYGKYTVFDYHGGNIVDIWTNPDGKSIDLIEHGNSPHGKYIRAFQSGDMINSNNNSQNSSVSGGINVNANYNYATQMNDFQTANPTGQVNMGQAAQGWGYTGGKSSIPFENEVKTSLLGGDIQHQESEINTNVEYLPEMNDPQDTISTLPYSPINLGGAGIALAGIGALLLMGRKK